MTRGQTWWTCTSVTSAASFATWARRRRTSSRSARSATALIRVNKRRRRLLPVGLRWRLTAWVAAVMLASAAVVFIVVYQGTGTQLTNQIERDIAGDTTQLAQAVRESRAQDAKAVSTAAARYVRAQPYTASSTLLFALVPGAHTVSNHPEVFGGP